MILMSFNLLQSTRLKCFVNTSRTMSRKLESIVMGKSRPKYAQYTLTCSNRREEKFFVNTMLTISRKLK